MSRRSELVVSSCSILKSVHWHPDKLHKGGLPAESRILDCRQAALIPQRDWQGQRVLVSAGPTQEPIDPVRFISNRSSGKMGYAIAEAARDRGAEVILVTGPSF